jgi:probable DNA metabolism protein
LERRIGAPGVETLYHAFLSEASGVEHALLRLVERVLREGAPTLEDLRFSPALATERLAGRVRHEVHRMHAFVRFERRAGERYLAVARPEHNVLPLLEEHFAARYPALRWAIVDVRRRYALVHTPAAEREAGAPATHFAPADGFEVLPEAHDEAAFQDLWQTYYHAVTIPARRNLKLHLRHVPRRYWPYLTEKRVSA